MSVEPRRFRRGGGRGVDGPTRNDPPRNDPNFDSSTLAWVRLCQKAVVLAAAWAEFKLALDDYGLMCHGGGIAGDSGGSHEEGAA